jgi:hypothetical protein
LIDADSQFHIVPNAKQNQVMGERGDAIKIKLRARRLWTQKRTLRCAGFWPNKWKFPSARLC